MKICLHLILFYFILFVCGNTFSQKISIKQRNETIGKGNNVAIVATIFEADVTNIAKEWKSLMKDHDAKVTMGGEIFADNAKIKGFDNTCDVYARIKNVSEGEKELMVAVDMGGTYLSGNNPDQIKRIENLMYDFALKITKEAIASMLKDAEKKYKKMIKEQETLSGEKEQMQKDIENYKLRISQTESGIAENGKMQEAKKLEIEKQIKTVEEIKEKLKSVK